MTTRLCGSVRKIFPHCFSQVSKAPCGGQIRKIIRIPEPEYGKYPHFNDFIKPDTKVPQGYLTFEHALSSSVLGYMQISIEFFLRLKGLAQENNGAFLKLLEPHMVTHFQRIKQQKGEMEALRAFDHIATLPNQEDIRKTVDTYLDKDLSEASKLIELMSNKNELFTTYGIEVEFSGVAKRKIQEKGINCTIDRSISEDYYQETHNFEYPSDILWTKDDLKNFMEDLVYLIKNDGYTNETCGVHVHFDPKKMLENILPTDQKQKHKLISFFIKQLVANYTFLEQQGLRFKPRRQPIQMLSHKIYETELSEFYKKFNISNITDMDPVLQNPLFGREFSPINIHAYAQHDTLEFRAHPGDITPLNIAAWMLLVNRLLMHTKIHIKEKMLSGELENFSPKVDEALLQEMLSEYKKSTTQLKDSRKLQFNSI